jgi:hypothetical protein
MWKTAFLKPDKRTRVVKGWSSKWGGENKTATKKKKNASSVGAKWKTRKNKKEKRHGLVFHAGVWNGVQWSAPDDRFCVFGKEQESNGRKESREYHVHRVLGTKVFGKITLSAGVVVVGVARVGVVGQRTVDWFCSARIYGSHRIRHEFFLDTYLYKFLLFLRDMGHLPP